MECRIISTGSRGNAVILQDTILIDCGVSFSRLAALDIKRLRLVLLTHIHSDHFNRSTLRKLSKERPTLRFACCSWLVTPLVECGIRYAQIDVIQPNKWYDYRLCKIKAQETTHDVKNCCWHICTQAGKAIYATDTGNLNGITAKGYDLYLIESNYTQDEIQDRIAEKKANGEYLYEKRVMKYHLSREAANDWLVQNMGAASQLIYMHQHDCKDN